MNAVERWALWLATAATAGTGAIYTWMRYFMQPVDEWAVINHPLEPLMLKLHIMTAPILVFVFGAVLARHVLPQFRNGIKAVSKSGLLVAAGVVPMIVTGYLIQVITHERLLQILAITHIILGVTYVVALGVHALRGSRAVGRDCLEAVPRPTLRVVGRELAHTGACCASHTEGPPSSCTRLRNRAHFD
ncbi:MAG: hypothetical protein JSW51_03180 [Gemmatimonadota bacterium]|nr:MAG: hypothetical protein JSW51_03180 [Gemmatimonadota bacterium]